MVFNHGTAAAYGNLQNVVIQFIDMIKVISPLNIWTENLLCWSADFCYSLRQSSVCQISQRCANCICVLLPKACIIIGFITFYRTLDSTTTATSGKSLIFSRKISISEKSSTIQIWKTSRCPAFLLFRPMEQTLHQLSVNY